MFCSNNEVAVSSTVNWTHSRSLTNDTKFESDDYTDTTGQAGVSTESSCLSLLSSLISEYDACHHARHSQWHRMTSQNNLHQALADIQGWYSVYFILCCNAPLKCFHDSVLQLSPHTHTHTHSSWCWPDSLTSLCRQNIFKLNDKENHSCVAVNKHQLRPWIKSPFSIMNDRHSCDRTPPPDLVTQRWRSIIKNSLFSFQISWMEVLVQVRKQRFSGNELQTTSCFGCPFFSTPKVTRLHWQNQTFYLTDNRKLSNFIALSKPPDSIHKSTRLTSSTTTLSGLTLKKHQSHIITQAL